MLTNPFLQYVIVLSPMYAAVELFRLPLTGAETNLSFLFISLSMSFMFLFTGILYFKKTEDFFADFA